MVVGVRTDVHPIDGGKASGSGIVVSRIFSSKRGKCGVPITAMNYSLFNTRELFFSVEAT